MSGNTFTDFEKTHGTVEFLKAIVSVQNKLLVDKGVITIEELKSRLQTELATRAANSKYETQKGHPTDVQPLLICPKCSNPIGSMATCTVCIGHNEIKEAQLRQTIVCTACGKIKKPGKPPATGEHCLECGAPLPRKQQTDEKDMRV